MTQAHSLIGASSMYRWSVCPGSVRMSKGIVGKSSSYAEEGTEAHELAAQCLRAGKNAWELADDAEQCEAVQVYLDYVNGLKGDSYALLVEHRFDLSSVHPGCFGTADAVVYHPNEKLLIVVDYKHGAGIAVEAKGNPQLRYYALGALLTTNFLVNRVRMVIVQPRCNHPAGPVREDEIDAIDLFDFRADLIGYAKATEDANAPLRAGDHCRFCPAAGSCPELHKQATAVAKLEFTPALPYDPKALSAALDKRDVVKAWLKNLDEFAYREAEAGRVPPGYKLVDKRATRDWRSEGDAALKLQDIAGLTEQQLYEPRSIKSPAQIELVLGGAKKAPAWFAPLVKKESSGKTLVHESDARPATKPTAALEFSPVPQP